MELSSLGRSTAYKTVATLGLAAIVVAGCAAPGPAATPPPTAAPESTAPAPSTGSTASTAPSASSAAAVPDCGTDPVTLNIYHETISELMPQLSAEFTKQYPERDVRAEVGRVRECHGQPSAAPLERQPA